MKLKKFIQISMFCAACSVAMPAMAQRTLAGLPPLHVDGNYLKDEQGNKVVLHGVMDTPNTYFNGGRWGGSYDDNGISRCIDYFDKLFTAITDHENGAYCTIFRLHLDPAWTNGTKNSWPVDSRETGDGEADISRYTGTRLTNYLNSVYIPIAQKAIKHGMYVIMRPPGVCPENIHVGGSYQKFLLDVWDRVSKNKLIQDYCGQVSLELANEPRNVKLANGQSNAQALHDFFQPIVEKIRENGFKGVIWVPGAGWQSSYADYAKYPITGDNIGYAVHDYVGWYGTDDNNYNAQNAINNFERQVPVVRTNPIVITEVDWSPQNTSNIKNYNEFGQPVYGNYGTWATGSTSRWGKAYKAILDYYGNISMTLTGTGDFIDIDDYINRKKVTPAFQTAMEKNGVDPYEACGVACFKWYEEYAKVNYPSTERYQPKQEVPENPFELEKDWYNPSLLYEGDATLGANSILKLKSGGFSGWRFEEEEGVDLSQYQYLAIRLARKMSSGNATFRIYDSSNIWDEAYEFPIDKTEKEMQIDLQNMTTASGKKIDPSHIRLAGFTTTLAAGQTLYVKEVVPVADETAINAMTMADGDEAKDQWYDLFGRKVSAPVHGIYIKKGKKVFIQ